MAVEEEEADTGTAADVEADFNAVLRVVQDFTDLNWGPGVKEQDFRLVLSTMLERLENNEKMKDQSRFAEWKEKGLKERIVNCADKIMSMSGGAAATSRKNRHVALGKGGPRLQQKAGRDVWPGSFVP